ncbi:MAG: glutathione S-transferase family protein [Gammaproteobacteria bacterium]|nr:glutathione S-transferase family protein [Gammaproteobacteria bacterium]
MKPELISFKLCPFVQRSVIVLEEKGIDYDITYINLKEPPQWFKTISPLGKVPLLKVGNAVLFESAVIMEYLDEVNPPSLHPTDPLRKAHNRAWVEFASTLFFCQFNMVMAKEQEACDSAEQELRDKLTQVEQQVEGPLFNGEVFSLVDAAYAPLFMRIAFLEKWHPMGLLDQTPKLQRWSEALLKRESVKNSVIEDLEQLYRDHISASNGFGASRFGNA